VAFLLKDIADQYKLQTEYVRLNKNLSQKKYTRHLLSGLSGSSRALVTCNLLQQIQGFHLFVLPDKEEAAFFYNDLLTCLEDDRVFFFPSSYKRSIQYGHVDSGNLLLRTNALNQLSNFNSEYLALITYPEALVEKVINKKKLETDTLKLHVGESVDIDFIKEILVNYSFNLVDFVYEPGQYAIRGSIIDIFSFAAEFPYRIDFFGSEVDSIRSFDIESQLSKTKYDMISILPNINDYSEGEKRESLVGFTRNKPVIWSDNFTLVSHKLREIIEAVSNENQNNETFFDTCLLYKKEEFIEDLAQCISIEFGQHSFFPAPEVYSFNTRPQPLFQKNFALLGDNLKILIAQNYQTFILSENEKQLIRLHDIFTDTHQGIPFNELLQTLHEGFIDDDLKICCYTDHQIFERYHKYRLYQYFSAQASVSLKELKDLKPGDYIVHIDHGIGRFGGLEKITINNRMQEAIKLVYRDNDVLYVNIHSLHRISKYKGKDDSEPKIYKLGTGAWQKLKETTKKKVKDIAKDLIALYAKRRTQEGFSFSADTYLQEELEASFIYEDTPDQVKTTSSVKSDMELKIPMDRLICGDVGFGKTEVAVRAAFKAVTDSKQVAVLVPTTILALQHYTTFRDRLKEFPCNVEYISRLKKPADQKRILADLNQGKVDILIGTHRLLGKDIQFKDLGLLIIDEEQKFGVSAKEKLKRLKINVDTLTMTATPIPRTLQFSLMGARDLSVINTPPPNRHPIVTELHTFNESIIQEGINYEVSRGGQVFFIHNRVENISEVENLVKNLCPEVRVAVGHGQMEGQKLEQVMIDFISGDYDVLVATTIIESGLDIPNANTIFINNAQNFGLSDLHQLRGRVGRSNKRAFCYLIAPPITMLTPEARRRLKAIEEFSDLGSGFNIALQDLDLRGAGNMLGAEQSGFIADIGFEAYNRILNEALQELKENEFKDLYALPAEQEKKTDAVQDIKYATDCIIDTDFDIHLPEEYIGSISERIRLYRQLDSIESEEELAEFTANLTDRFGPVPKPAKALLQVVRLRWLAEKLGFEKLIVKNKKLIAFFVSDQNSSFYESRTFINILNFVQQNPTMFRMKEGKNKLTLIKEGVEGISDIYNLLSQIVMNHE
jgi:transcription-repair coupling factor (superfamily II helicase)